MTIAFVFPGQGSQSVGMLAAMAEQFEEIQATFAEASTVLGYDLWQLVTEGPEEQLNATEYTQPAMLAAGVASWRAWRAAGGGKPMVMAGHSLGEYSALVCAGAIEFEDAVALVRDRARFMQEAVPEGEGAMAAILGLDDRVVRQVCESAGAGEVLEPVNFNAPGQVVIAGTSAAIARAVDQARDAGAKRALVLPVSVPSHCALMRPASTRMAERLRNVRISLPGIPVIHNVNVAVATAADEIRELLARQVAEPVRWVETVKQMYDDGAATVIECGPGKVLCGLTKRINRELNCIPLQNPADMDAALEA